MFRFFKRLAGASVANDVGIAGSLRGRYDLSGSTLAGYVRIEHGMASPGMQIFAVRDGVDIASVTPGPVAADETQPFSMNIEGLFTPAELARGTVTIAARNRRGDTGTLTLQGSTMLELVRDYFGVPSETVFDLDFTGNGNARPYLGAGWSRTEKDYTWAIDDESVIRFETPGEKGNYLLRLTCAAFIAPALQLQVMDIKLDGELVASVADGDGSMQFREFRIEGSAFTAAPQSTLQFIHPHAARPSEHRGTTDVRRLAFRFRRLSLVRVLPDSGGI